MKLEARLVHIFPMHIISSLEVDCKHFCWILEDTARPKGHKLNGYTSLPRGYTYYVGIRYSPMLKRNCLSIYTEDDGETIKIGGIEFKYVMFHGGNDHTNTDGCPLTGFNLIDSSVSYTYRGKKIKWNEKIVQGTAEKALFNLVKPELDKSNEVTFTT